MAKFKLNKVVEPFTQEDVENIYSAAFDGDVFYSCYPNNNWDDEYSIEPFKNGDKVYAGVRCSHYDCNTEEYKFMYEYVFEAGIDESKGITSVGWYSYDNTTDAYTFVEGDIEIELPMEPTEAPSDWDPEWGEWVNPWITPYFYKIVTEVVEGNPDYVEPKEIEYKIKRSTLVDIANAIREKTGKTDLIKVSDLDDAIKELSAGGGVGSSKIIDAPASSGEPPVGCKPHDIIRLYEEFEDTSVIVGRQNGPLPMGNQGYRVSDVVFNTNTPDEEVLEAFKSVFPDLDYAYSNRKDSHYFFYNNSADYIVMGIGLVSPDDDTILSLYIRATRGNGLSSPIWECYVNKADYSIVSGGSSWATSFMGFESENVTVGDGVITVHFKDIEALSNDPCDTGASGTFAETFYPIISTERIEYGKKREYVVLLYYNEDGTFTELVSKQ